MDNFLPALIGGVVIGFSSSILLGGIGRLPGISGILGETLGIFKNEHYWKYSFIFGLLLTSIIYANLVPSKFDYEINSSIYKVVIAGLLVGFGTRLGNGCTSGHGVCGVARMAKRSLIATITFIAFGMLTVYLERVLS